MQSIDLVYSTEYYLAQEGEMQTDKETKDIVAERISTRMVDLKINQVGLAELTGIDQRTLSRYINAWAAPSAANLTKMAPALQCTVGYLLGLEVEANPPSLPADPLSGLSDDERLTLLNYRERRIALQNEIINEGVAKLADPIRNQVKRIVARLLAEQGKFDNLNNKP